MLGSGLVSFAVVTDGKPTWTMTTIGYGTARKVAWGVGPPRADLEAWTAAPSRSPSASAAPASPDVYEAPEAAAVGVAPHVDLGECKVTGGLAPRAVRTRVDGKLSAIDDCYGDAVAASAKVGGGAIEVAFAIDDDGWAAGLAALTGAAHAAIKTCVTDTMEGLQFATSGGGASPRVTCTLTFDPGKRAPPAGKKPGKPRLLTKAHPARGGPDLRGLQRIP